MKIGIDVDDVVADLHPVWIARLNKVHGKQHTVEDITQWHFAKDLGYTENEVYAQLVPELYDDVQPCEGALEVVNDLRRAGHEVVYITSCPDAKHWVRKSRWLIEQGFMLPRDQAIPVGKWAEYKTKREVGQTQGVSVLVDDSIANCTDWAGYALLLTRKHNRNELYMGKRLKTFRDVLSVVKYMPTHVGSLPTSVEPGNVITYEPVTEKPTNPKDAVATDKVPLHFVSGVVKAYASIAHYLGNVKYGAWNYRAGGARASVYKAALDRHMDRWWEGEQEDAVDGTPHLANALACINILIECQENGNLVDDRPPSRIGVLNKVYKKIETLMPKIREFYKDRPQPKHFTIGDNV